MTDKKKFRSLKAWLEAYREGPATWRAAWVDTLASARGKSGFRAAMVSSLSGEELERQWSEAVPGPLQGVPWMLKDLFDVALVDTAASSKFLTQVRPTPMVESALVGDVGAAGGVLVGKTHLNEFAYGLDGVNPHFGTVPNPVLPGRLAGGSSSGSAWAVASGLVPFAVGTDTGGSIRVPAAFCGLYGFRLTPEHRWSKDGCFPLAPSFDTAGFFTGSAADLSIVLSLLDEAVDEPVLPIGLDLTSASEMDGKLSKVMQECLAGWTRMASGDEALEWHADTADLVASFNILQSSEALELHRDWLHTRKVDYDPATWQRIARAEGWTAEQRASAGKTAAIWKTRLTHWIEEMGFLVLPTAPGIAPKITDGMSSDLREGILAMTTPASLAGHPVLSIPVGRAPDTLTAVQIVLPKKLSRAVSLARRILSSAISR